MTNSELATDLAAFFNKISKEFTPLRGDEIENDNTSSFYLQPHEVSSRLQTFKKPKSMVSGNLFPQCVMTFCDLIAIPLTKIFNTIMAMKKWPNKRKKETMTIIPKSTTASSYGECRNCSCTPLFSKVMELFLMDKINSEVKIDLSQYGGVKKCGTEHFLTQAWDNILEGLEHLH